MGVSPSLTAMAPEALPLVALSDVPPPWNMMMFITTVIIVTIVTTVTTYPPGFPDPGDPVCVPKAVLASVESVDRPPRRLPPRLAVLVLLHVFEDRDTTVFARPRARLGRLFAWADY